MRSLQKEHKEQEFMITSSLNNPSKEPLIIIRKWQLKYCNGNACAAALLSFFAYWHDIKIESSRKAQEANNIAEMHGEKGYQDISLLQFHTAKQIKDGIMIYSVDAIRSGIALLVKLGCLESLNNPNPRYKFDKTRFFLFHPEVCNSWIKDYSDMEEENQRTYKENQRRSSENQTAITKITSETTREKTPIVPTSGDEGSPGNLFEMKPPKEESPQEIIRSDVFPYYLQVMNKNPKIYTLTPKRLKKGVDRFKESLARMHGDRGKAVELMKCAIDALAADDFMMGREKGKPKVWNDWEKYLFNSTENFEKWLEKS